MCGLFGFVDYKNYWSGKEKEKLIFTLAKESKIRGTDATGIAYCTNEILHIFKRPIPSYQIKFHLDKKVSIVMGHTRMATQGNHLKNYNNHPFWGKAGEQPFALAHNGIIYNDKILRKDLSLPSTSIETDSYIAVQLIEKQNGLSFYSLQKMAELVEGSFTFTILDTQNNLYIVKGNSPCFLYHFQKEGFYIYASTSEILDLVLKKLNLLNYQKKIISIREGEILKIDVNGQCSLSYFELKRKENFSYQFSYETDSIFIENIDTEYLDFLYQYGKYCGISKYEIELLYLYGYEQDEIEELLYDIPLLRSILEQIEKLEK